MLCVAGVDSALTERISTAANNAKELPGASMGLENPTVESVALTYFVLIIFFAAAASNVAQS